METPDIEELAEVPLTVANERLKHGWVFIRCLAILHKVEDGKYSEMGLYVMGKLREPVKP